MNKSELAELWGNFIAGFCKVQFLCYGGEPNWLGWIVIAFAVFLTLVFSLALLAAVFSR